MSRDLFEDWKARADESDLYEVAIKYGAALKRTGREWVGPCVACGGRDRFALSQTKHKWHCRSHGGGHGAISLAMHLGGLSFVAACEDLTGEPNPTGERSKPLTEEQRAARNRVRLENEARAANRKAQEVAYQENTRETAQAIWNASQPISGTLAQVYLNKRGIVLDQWPDVLRFHPALPYPNKTKTYPVLVCRVDDVSGDLTAVWRIYLREDGRKADVDSPKMGLGPAAGGAVRIGGIARKIAIAEGLESALGYWLLTGQKHPAWAALSTSGLIGFEAPLGVEHTIVVPDGDRPIKRQGHDFIPTVPAGRKAAEALRSRLLTEGITTTIAAEPPESRDYLDLWTSRQGETAHEKHLESPAAGNLRPHSFRGPDDRTDCVQIRR